MAALGLTALIALTVNVPGASARAGCAHATDAPSEATSLQFRDAIICLINEERHDHGISKLSVNGKLNQAAGEHTQVMVDEQCFEHRCPGEKGIRGRLKDVGYLKGETWSYGEGIGYDGTPRQMFHAFMDSNYHRKLILGKRFEDIGAGARKGAPVEIEGDVVTYTFDVGVVG
jgi:uncharacterized protein YkwD